MKKIVIKKRTILKYGIIGEVIFIICLFILLAHNNKNDNSIETFLLTPEDNYIRWVDFDITTKALRRACQYDIESQDEEVKLNWIELLAYLGAKYGGDFSSRYREKDMNKLVEKLRSKEETMESVTKDLEHCDYYLEAYTAILEGFV